MRKLGFDSEAQLIAHAVLAETVPEPEASRDGGTDGIRPRERQIVEKLLDGYTSKEIARLLGISPLTVRKHRQNLMARLGVHTTAELLVAVRTRNLPVLHRRN